jgi:antitoxin component YwqK of YwqJK toxin-antitoxin module
LTRFEVDRPGVKPMSEEWYYAQDGQQMGPVSLEEIHRLAVSRMLQPPDLVWTDGMNSWSPAGCVSELASAFPIRDKSRPLPPNRSRRDNPPLKGHSTASDVDFHDDLTTVPNLFEQLSAFCRSHPLASSLTGIGFVSVFFCCGLPLALMSGKATKQQAGVVQRESIPGTVEQQPITSGIQPEAAGTKAKIAENPHSTTTEPNPRPKNPASFDAVGASQKTPTEILQLIPEVEFTGVDYSKGPDGEPLLTREGKDEKTGKPTTESGFIDKSGKFRRHGLRITWFVVQGETPTRKKYSELDFFDGQEHGLYRDWYQTGELHTSITLWKGKAQGRTILYFKDGTISKIKGGKDGMAEGPACEWHPNGKIKSSTFYSKGFPVGRSLTWYESGRLASDYGFNPRGKIDGEVVEWSADGVKSVLEYQDDKVVFRPGISCKLAFVRKLQQVVANPGTIPSGHTSVPFQEPLIAEFGEPDVGVLFPGKQELMKPVVVGGRQRSQTPPPREWTYNCSDGPITLKLKYRGAGWIEICLKDYCNMKSLCNMD